jgi:hypothetical protein
MRCAVQCTMRDAVRDTVRDTVCGAMHCAMCDEMDCVMCHAVRDTVRGAGENLPLDLARALLARRGESPATTHVNTRVHCMAHCMPTARRTARHTARRTARRTAWRTAGEPRHHAHQQAAAGTHTRPAGLHTAARTQAGGDH